MSTTRYPAYLEDVEHGRKLREEQDAVGVGQQFPDQLVEDDHLARVADDARIGLRQDVPFQIDFFRAVEHVRVVGALPQEHYERAELLPLRSR